MPSLIRGVVRALSTSPVPFVSSKLQGPRLQAGRPEQAMSAYGAVGTLFAIVNRTSNGTSQVNWRLYRKSRSGLEAERTEVTAHAALDLWNQPNPWMPRQLFVEGFQQHVDLTGEGWWIISRAARSSLPLSMFYVRPDRIAPVPSAQKYLAGYLYFGPDGEKIPLELDEVIQLRMPNPLDQYRGLGPVQAALVDVDSARYSAEWNRNFFINDATPGGIIKVDKRLTDPEWKEMTERWREQHQGVANAHRVAVLEQGEWVTNSFSMRDMQFVELRNVSRELIREAFGFPKPMLGATDDVNRANAEAAEVVFARWLLVPRLERIKGALNTQLLALYGDGTAGAYEFDYDDPTPQDIASEMAELTARVQALVALLGQGFDPVETLEVVGLPEIPMVVAAAGDTAAGKLSPAELAELLQKIYLATPEKLVISTDEARDIVNAAGGNLTGPTPTMPAVPAGPPALEPAAHHRHRPRAQDDAVRRRQLDAVQSDWESVLGRLWGDWAGVRDRWYSSLSGQVRAAVDAGDTEALAAMTVDSSEGADLLASAMRQLARLASQRVVEEGAEQGVNLEAVAPDATTIAAFAAATAALLGGAAAASAGREALRVRTPSSTPDEVAAGVRAFLDGLTGALDQEQLGGALTNAQNTARLDTMAEGPTAAYYGDETLDANTCDPCRFVDGKWLGNDIAEARRLYPNGGYYECEGRSRCRGTVVAVWRGGDDPSEWIEKEPVDTSGAAW